MDHGTNHGLIWGPLQMGIPKGRVHVETNNKSGYQGFKENSDARVSLLPN